jgi:thioredoxin reductase (NADPH)
MKQTNSAEVIIVGGGLAGLSAAIYLGRAKRDTIMVDSGKSMARWEPDVQNYLGFPSGISGEELLARARRQARRCGIKFRQDEILSGRCGRDGFILRGKNGSYEGRCVLLATGIFHIPPDLPHTQPCLGHSMFFCKDCDGLRVLGKSVAVYGWNNETVEYALGLLSYSPCVAIVTDGRAPRWDGRHTRWIKEYEIPVYRETIVDVRHTHRQIEGLELKNGSEISVDALFTTRGDIYFNKLAKSLHASVDREGQIIVDHCMRTTLKGLYAAGCVTPANCQMIIAAGQGAAAAQAINRDLFEQSLASHSLRRFRLKQLRDRKTRPRVKNRRPAARES